MRSTFLRCASSVVCAIAFAGFAPFAHGQTATFTDDVPAQYAKGSGQAITFNVPDNMPAEADVLVLAWSDEQQQMVNAFAHRLSDGPWQIAAEQLEKLPLGRTQLQLLTLNSPGGQLVTQWIEIVEKPGIAFADDAPDTITKGESTDVGFDVTGTVPDGADVLALAWSESESRMVNGYSHTLAADATMLDSEQFADLPTGRTQLQLMLRVDNAKAAPLAKKWVEVEAAPEPEPVELSIAFDDDAPATFEPGSDTGVGYDVTGTLPSDGDVLILAWSDSENRMVDAFAHTRTEGPWTITPEQLSQLPAGPVLLQAMIRTDAAGTAIADIDEHGLEIVQPDNGGGTPDNGTTSIDDVTGVSSGATVEGEVDIEAIVSGNVQRVEFTLFHDNQNVNQMSDNMPPYSYLGDTTVWDTSQADPGEYTLFVDAYDSVEGEPVDTVAIPFAVRDQMDDDPPTANPEGLDQGWVQLDADNADRIVFVSSSQGDDANDGLSQSRPVRSISRGKQLMRNGRADWLLLKRGDVFHEPLGQWNMSGASSDRKMVIGAYGSGRRPEIRPHGADLMNLGSGVRHIAFTSLHAHATQRNPSHPDFNGGYDKTEGIWMYGSGGDLYFDDCLFEYFNNNIVLQSRSLTERITDIELYRTTLRYSYSVGDQGFAQQGIFATRLTNVTLRECVLYHNGWSERNNDDVRTMFGHNLYLNGTENILIEDTIVAYGSLNGLNLRIGNKDGDVLKNATVRGCLFVGNANAVAVAGKQNRYVIGRNAKVQGNVMTHGGGAHALDGGFLFVANGITLSSLNGADVRDNLLLRTEQGSGSAAIKVQTWQRPKSSNVTITDNTVYQWGENRMDVNKSGVSAFNNRVGWSADRFVDASRTLNGYVNARTDRNNMRAWVDRASSMRLGDWDNDFMAAPAVKYLKDGFTPK
jgi:hypothetical protein